MNKMNLKIVLVATMLFILPLTNLKYSSTKILIKEKTSLPPPQKVDMLLEISIARRKSVREFNETPVSDEILSTILWASYGYINDEKRTIHGIEGYAAKIYVLKEDAVYFYDPLNHSLVLYKKGDYRRRVAQYEAPIQLGIIWDKNKSENENYVAAEIGEIGQNIYFMANALGLGTVTTLGMTLSAIGLPSNEVPKIIMPLGYAECPYNFTYKPMLISNLPSIKNSSTSLWDAIYNRSETNIWKGEINKEKISQILWAAYGFSYYIDNCITEENKIVRHRTVPSAHAYYPLKIYAVTKNGVYRYIPGVYRYYMWNLPVFHSIIKIRQGDYRKEIAKASSMPSISSAPLILISVLDVRMTKGMIGLWDDFSGEEFRWLWYYEAGASAHNVLLEATAWNLSANIVLPTNNEEILNVLKLNKNFLPLLIIPVGE
ncbi:MAG: nitroreductase family protein [Candidatus Thermoplasmatota archaeon]